MKFYHYDGVCYVNVLTRKELPVEPQKVLDNPLRRPWLHPPTPCGLMPLYAWKDCLNFFSHLTPAHQR